MGANAQTAVPAFTAGQILTAAQQTQINTGVPVFATTVTRDAAFGGAGEKTLAEGQMCYIEAAPQRLQVYNGTAWIDYDTQYTAFTPTWTGYTRGNGTTDSRYVRIGKMVHCYASETLGTTSSVTGALQLTLPVTARATASVQVVPYFADNLINVYGGIGLSEGTTSASLYAINAAGTYGTIATISATIPFTWGNLDFFRVTVIYEAA